MYWVYKCFIVLLISIVFLQYTYPQSIQYLGSVGNLRIIDIEAGPDGTLYFLGGDFQSAEYILKRHTDGVYEMYYQFENEYLSIAPNEMAVSSSNEIYLLDRQNPKLAKISNNKELSIIAGNRHFGVPEGLPTPISMDLNLPVAQLSILSIDSSNNIFFSGVSQLDDQSRIPVQCDAIYKIDTNNILSVYAGGADTRANPELGIDRLSWKGESIFDIRHDFNDQLYIAETTRLNRVHLDETITFLPLRGFTFKESESLFAPINANNIMLFKNFRDLIIQNQNGLETVLFTKNDFDSFLNIIPNRFTKMLLSKNSDLYLIHGKLVEDEMIQLFKIPNVVKHETGIQRWFNH